MFFYEYCKSYLRLKLFKKLVEKFTTLLPKNQKSKKKKVSKSNKILKLVKNSGQEKWVNRLQWDNLDEFRSQNWQAEYAYRGMFIELNFPPKIQIFSCFCMSLIYFLISF